MLILHFYLTVSGLNNNERDYFYFHNEDELPTPYCAFLQLTISIKSDLHYETLLKSKILQLTEPFQNKLGHLVGTLYSRVGTEDWPREDLTKQRDIHLDKIKDIIWSTVDIHEKVMKALETEPIENQNAEKFLALRVDVRKRETNRINKALEIFSAELRLLNIDEKNIEKICKKLINNADFRILVK